MRFCCFQPKALWCSSHTNKLVRYLPYCIREKYYERAAPSCAARRGRFVWEITDLPFEDRQDAKEISGIFHGMIFRMDEDGEAFVPGPELRLPEDLVLPPTNKLFSVILKVSVHCTLVRPLFLALS